MSEDAGAMNLSNVVPGRGGHVFLVVPKQVSQASVVEKLCSFLRLCYEFGSLEFLLAEADDVDGACRYPFKNEARGQSKAVFNCGESERTLPEPFDQARGLPDIQQ